MGTAQRKGKGSAQAWNAGTPKGGAQHERHARPVKVVTPVATEAPLVLEASQQILALLIHVFTASPYHFVALL